MTIPARQTGVLAVLAGILVLALPASAHTIGLSQGTWRLDGPTLTVDLVLARPEAYRLVERLGKGAEGLDGNAGIDAAITSRIDVRRAGEPCPGTAIDGGQTESDGFWVRLRYACPDTPGTVRVDMGLLDSLGAGHRHLARVIVGASQRDEVLVAGHTAFDVKPGAPKTWGFLRMGIEHILTGFDHLVFLLGLILLGGRVRTLVGTVTAFTVAHSVTLAVAALGVFSPGSRLVEPAIAITIAYVGIENLFLKEPVGRWRIAFVLGLVHGFGFAGALADLGLQRGQLLPALVLFNVGVEVGQVAVLAVSLPIVLAARRLPFVTSRVVPAVSVGIALTGAVLFVLRVS